MPSLDETFRQLIDLIKEALRRPRATLSFTGSDQRSDIKPCVSASRRNSTTSLTDSASLPSEGGSSTDSVHKEIRYNVSFIGEEAPSQHSTIHSNVSIIRHQKRRAVCNPPCHGVVSASLLMPRHHRSPLLEPAVAAVPRRSAR
jgi:hypothetical protein